MQTNHLHIALWPGQKDALGNGTDYGNLDNCDSFWIALRAADPKDLDAYRNADMQVLTHLGIWCWFMRNRDGGVTVNLEVRARDIHSLTLREAESLLKSLRALCKRMPVTANGTDGFELRLRSVLTALRIKTCINYAPIVKPVLSPVDDALVAAVAEYTRRVGRLA